MMPAVPEKHIIISLDLIIHFKYVDNLIPHEKTSFYRCMSV